MNRPPRFTFAGVDLDYSTSTITGHYEVGGRCFSETWGVGDGADLAAPGVSAAAKWLYLFGGVSYFKAMVPPVLDTGDLALTDDDATFLRTFYLDGLGEFSYRNGLSLDDLEVIGSRFQAPDPVHLATREPRALVPFGGGIDSIVTVEAVKRAGFPASLFICSRPGDVFAAIEAPAAVTGLPILRATRHLDPQIFATEAEGWWNGHVPITGVLSALAVVTALAHGFTHVIMSNEHSASDPNVVENGRAINHQWSKSETFERGLRAVLGASMTNGPEFFSYLRARSELWVGEQFAHMAPYHPVFRSCNKAFYQRSSDRLEEWCGVCDKCCFIDLILSPYLSREELQRIFSGREPLENDDLAPVFSTLCGLVPMTKPFECVGDVTECAAAASLAARRPDRRGNAILGSLTSGAAIDDATIAALLRPIGDDAVPELLHRNG